MKKRIADLVKIGVLVPALIVSMAARARATTLQAQLRQQSKKRPEEPPKRKRRRLLHSLPRPRSMRTRASRSQFPLSLRIRSQLKHLK